MEIKIQSLDQIHEAARRLCGTGSLREIPRDQRTRLLDLGGIPAAKRTQMMVIAA